MIARVTIRCDYCDGPIVPVENSPGYATRLTDGLTSFACYACCAWLAVIDMRAGIDPGLYASERRPCEQWTVSIWPCTLTMRVVRTTTARHNLAGKTTTLHFIGPDGQLWTGTEYHGPASGNLLRKVHRLKGSKVRWTT
jgi:hypothetical protein